MTLVYILVCCVPFLIIILTFMVIGSTASRFYRAGKTVYVEVSPTVENLKKSASDAQSKSSVISEKSQSIAKAFEEISGRLAFIHEAYEEIMDSPAVRFANIARKFSGRK
ncbi:MAG: hypothetical protein JW738_07095 [Actinobacteria bacterium]|nr:hypothetical protein [Actinomycetota bacterium]